jgi:hypothetical protein
MKKIIIMCSPEMLKALDAAFDARIKEEIKMLETIDEEDPSIKIKDTIHEVKSLMDDKIPDLIDPYVRVTAKKKQKKQYRKPSKY